MSVNGSTKLIALLYMSPSMTSDTISKLCREKKMYGYRKSTKSFEPWVIPAESFSLYLRYNKWPYDLYTLNDQTQEFMKEVDKYRTKSYLKETFSIGEIIALLGIPYKMAIRLFITKNPILSLFCSKDDRVPSTKLIRFLCGSPTLLSALSYRQEDELQEKRDYILMLQTYYATYGYLPK